MNPDVTLLISTQCPHCHNLEGLLQQRRSSLGDFSIINIEQNPDITAQFGVRSVPWMKMGEYTFAETLSPKELDRWIALIADGQADTSYALYLLEHGRLEQAIAMIDEGKVEVANVVAVLLKPDVPMNVRIGVAAIIEHLEGAAVLQEIIPTLRELLLDSEPSNRIDACYFISLTHDSSSIELLKPLLHDDHSEVRQHAGDAIKELSGEV